MYMTINIQFIINYVLSMIHTYVCHICMVMVMMDLNIFILTFHDTLIVISLCFHRLKY